MAKYHESSSVFNFTWDQVASGYWKRYPNPQSTHVLSEDTISREIKNGCLHSIRLLTKTNRVPKWGERFFSAKSVKIVEESIVDPKNKVLVTYTRNLGYTKVMSVVERVEYSQGKGDQTTALRSAWVDSQVFGFSRAIRAFGVERYRKNCGKTVSGFEYILHTLYPKQEQGSSQSPTMADTIKCYKDAARTATDRAKANVYASVHPQSN